MINEIFNEDCVLTLDRMEDDLLDLTITSPPYNVDLKYINYDDNRSMENYLEWLTVIFSKIYAKTKTGGRCVINIGDQKNGQISLHTEIINLMNKIGWLNFSIIIWNKNTCNARTAWGSYQSPSQPSFPRPFEYILIFAKKQLNLNFKAITDLSKKEFADWSYGLWAIKPETKKIDHPAPFPIDIPKRCMKMLSWVDSIVYDPFMGSGTTAIACKITNRKYIGSEISNEYCQISENRLKSTITYTENSYF